jgi:hypothetical protein
MKKGVTVQVHKSSIDVDGQYYINTTGERRLDIWKVKCRNVFLNILHGVLIGLENRLGLDQTELW